MNTSMIFDHLRYQYHRHGPLAVLGLALIACAVGWERFAIPEISDEVTTIKAQQTVLREKLKNKPVPEQTLKQRQVAFYETLPTPDRATHVVERIHEVALAQGVQLATGEYRLVREGGETVVRYQMTFPAVSSYPKLRSWMAELMNEIPSLAIDEINMRRDDAGSSSVEARVRFTLFMKAS